MMIWVLALLAFPARGIERALDFGGYPLDQTPPGFRSLVAGRGAPGEWKVVLDEVAPVLAPFSPKAESVTGRAVLAQLARTATASRFPMLIFEGADYGDFKLTTRIKLVGGALEQTAGVVFHFLNESNFYVVRASALRGDFRCFKVANGEWKPPIGPSAEIAKGVWHDLSVECEGTRILCLLDGTNAIKLIDSSGNRPGKIGFWTEADSVSYFTDTRITYTEHESPVQKLVRDALTEYPRLLGLRIYTMTADGRGVAVAASKDPKDIGQPGGEAERDVISRGARYFGKAKGSAFVTVPLRDRNGDPIAAVCVILKTFPGQTEDNAFARAQPVVQRMQTQVQSPEDVAP